MEGGREVGRFSQILRTVILSENGGGGRLFRFSQILLNTYSNGNECLLIQGLKIAIFYNFEAFLSERKNKDF